jgi:hypothetical protein
MAVEVTVRDETTSGDVLLELELQFDDDQLSVADLIRTRVQAEVRRYGADAAARSYRGLVQPEEHERRLNGPGAGRRIDVERQVEVALDAFERGRVLVLVDDRQVIELNDRVWLRAGSAVTFLKLVPLVGG